MLVIVAWWGGQTMPHCSGPQYCTGPASSVVLSCCSQGEGTGWVEVRMLQGQPGGQSATAKWQTGQSGLLQFVKKQHWCLQ